MPRASGSSKRLQGAAGHRDTKHDNGLVGPGKRAAGRKSQGQAEASSRPAADHHGSACPVQPSLAQASAKEYVAANGNGVPKIDLDGARNASTVDPLRRDSLGNYSETSTDSSGSNVGANGVVENGHRLIDVNALKNVDVHKDSGPLELATSVLKSLPLQDTLAILIILMHVPPISLSAMYALFTFLTFVPPVTTASGMNINFAEIFDGTSTMPSLVTVLCMDVFFLLIWLFLWGPVQDALLDFAKPVIAITLGGGVSAKDGTSRGFTTCFTWVLLHHLLRGTRAHWSRLAHHIPEDWRLPGFLSESLEPAAGLYDKRNFLGWLRSGLAIHILTQGVVRYVREWYLRREKANAAASIGDPEAGKASNGSAEGSAEAGFGTLDAEAGLQQAHNPASTKKRRKQSTQVRLQQPLWSALASTKIVMMKEYEMKHATSKSAGKNARDIHNLGNAPFSTQQRQIWISYIGSDEVCFSTSHFPEPDYSLPPPPANSNGDPARPSVVDLSKPFYVRINRAFWQATRMFAVEQPDGEPQEGTCWTGDIYALRPASRYVFDFVDTRTDDIIFSTSIRTVQEPQREADSSSTALPNGQRSLQPDSPATTLKTSIAAAEAKLADEKNRLKTARKEWKTRINALKKDNELTDNQLSSAGNHDEKYKQKIRQQETQKAQLERDIESLAEQLKNFDTAPELTDRKKKMERAYSAEKKIFDAAQKEFKEHKSRLEKEVNAKEVEKSNLNTRRNKVATRIAKVENELANITDANNRGIDEAERRQQERAQWQEHVAAIESNYNERLSRVRATNVAKGEHIKVAQTQLQSFHEYMNSATGMPLDMGAAAELGQPPFPPQSAWNPAAPPHFPIGMWTGSASDLNVSMSAAGGLSGVAAWQPPPTAPPFEPRGFKSRGRSSSMLSDVSGFTQSSDDDEDSPADSQRRQQLWTNRARGSADSGSIGASTGSGSGSTGEPTSPT